MQDEKETLQEVRIKLTRIEGLLEKVIDTTNLKLEHVERRVLDLESSIRWLWRTTIGAVIVTVIGTVIAIILKK